MANDSKSVSTLTRRIDRRAVVRLLGLTPLAGLSGTLLAGCGGGGGGSNNSDNYLQIDTGQNGSFAGAKVGPTPGAVYISTDTTFLISWPDATLPPPASFTVSLQRYEEARGSADRSVGPQKIQVAQNGAGVAAWTVRRKDGFPLDSNATYYLQVTASGQSDILAAFITSTGRAAVLPAKASVPTRVSTGFNGLAANVVLSPSTGSVFIPKHTTFQLAWSASAPPPPDFNVNLMRFKEALGGQNLDLSAQKVDIVQQDTYTYTVTRQDGFDLDQGGVYFLEITAAGETPVRSAYIVSLER